MNSEHCFVSLWLPCPAHRPHPHHVILMQRNQRAGSVHPGEASTVSDLALTVTRVLLTGGKMMEKHDGADGERARSEGSICVTVT